MRAALFIALALVWVQSVHANVPIHSLNAEQRSQVAHLLKTDISKDIKDHFEDRVVNDIGNFFQGEKMTPETQAILIKGMYEAMRVQLIPYGLVVDEAYFTRNVNRILSWSSQYGLYPSALTLGAMGHLQYGIGAGYGVEFNFYINHGDVKVSSYQIMGLELGVKEALTFQFYAALCFGSCTGGGGEGVYVGLDGMGGFGLGAGFYVEVGVDLTDLIYGAFASTYEVIKDLYQSRAVYVGFGIDVGEVVGISGNAYYYDLDVDKILVPRGKMISSSTISSMKLF